MARFPSLFFVIVFLSWSHDLRADSPAPPHSYKQASPDGKYVFVMIPPVTLEEDVRRWNEETAQGIRDIRQIYKQSGLYRNDGSTTPLWTVDWYAFGVKISSDGKHLIRHGPWASSTDNEAISFFADGKLLRTWFIRELVDHPAMLKHTVSHFFWEKEASFDDVRLEYSLSTEDGNKYIFDLRTGEITDSSRPPLVYKAVAMTDWRITAAICAVATACGFVAVLLVRRRRRKLAASTSTE